LQVSTPGRAMPPSSVQTLKNRHGPSMNPGTMLLAFCKHLSDLSLTYCLLGDSQDLPHRIRGDVDLVVGREVFDKLDKIILAFCATQNSQLAQRMRHESTAIYYILWWRDGSDIHYLHLDICSDFVRFGRRLISAEDLLTGSFQACTPSGVMKGFMVASPASEFRYYLFKKIDKKQLDERHSHHLHRQWLTDPESVEAAIQHDWPSDVAKTLIRAARDNEWKQILLYLPGLQHILRVRHRLHFGDRVADLLRLVERAMQPTGLFIAIMGADGSGKSAIIEQLRHVLAPAFRQIRYFHLRPRLEQRDSRSSVPVTDPHAMQNRHWLPSMLKITYFVFDYGVGFLSIILPLRLRSTLVIFDRYYPDVLVDPRRFRYGGPRWYAKWISNWIPKPDQWILLDADPTVLQSRKQEVSFEECHRQREAYLLQIRGFPNHLIVNTEQPVTHAASMGRGGSCPSKHRLAGIQPSISGLLMTANPG
jgi:thymidylate kinase